MGTVAGRNSNAQRRMTQDEIGVSIDINDIKIQEKALNL